MMKAHLFAKAKPNTRHWYAYDVVIDGETVLTDSRDPEHDLARALLARGIRGKVTFIRSNTGTPGIIIDIQKAAKFHGRGECEGAKIPQGDGGWQRLQPRNCFG